MGTSARRIGRKGELKWLLWIDGKKEVEGLALTNKNLWGTGCDSCVFNSNATPKDIRKDAKN